MRFTIMTATLYRCISDRYTPEAETYASVDAFLDMCQASFGERPELRQDGECYRDDQGTVLEPVADLLQRDPRPRPETWHLVTPAGTVEYSSLGEAIRGWWNRGHDTPELTRLPHITACRTAADLTWLLEERGIEHTVTEGAIECQLPEGRSLLLYQHEHGEGADIAGLWAWRETDAHGEQSSGALDTYPTLEELVS